MLKTDPRTSVSSRPVSSRADIEAQRVLTQAVIDECIALLAMQPPTSPVHNVETWLDGFRVPVPCGHELMHIYALPWSRGWSIFTELAQNAYTTAWFKKDEATHVAAPAIGAFSWRYVPRRLQGLQRPLYAPKDPVTHNGVGPHNVAPTDIVAAVLAICEPITRLDKLRRARARAAETRKRMWYWPRAASRTRTEAHQP